MKFCNWVKRHSYNRQGEKVINAKKVLLYIRNKVGEPYDDVRKEILVSGVSIISVSDVFSIYDWC